MPGSLWEQLEERRRRQQAMLQGLSSQPAQPLNLWEQLEERQRLAQLSSPAAPSESQVEERAWWKKFFYPDPEESGRALVSSAAHLGRNLARLGAGASALMAPAVSRSQAIRLGKAAGTLGDLAERTAPEDERDFRERFASDPLTATARAVAGAAPSLAPVVAGTAIGGPAGGAAAAALVSAPTAGVDAYDSSLAAGADHKTSLGIGAAVGTLTGLLDAIGGKAVGKVLEKGIFGAASAAAKRGATGELAKRILTGTATEVSTEELQELIAATGEVAAGRPLAEVAAELPDRMLEVGVASAGLTLGVGGVSRAGQRKLRQRARKQERLATPEGQLEHIAGMEKVLGTFRELSPEEQVALMDPASPAAVAAALDDPGAKWAGFRALSLDESLEFDADVQKAAEAISPAFYRGRAEVFAEEHLVLKAVRNLVDAGLVDEKTGKEWADLFANNRAAQIRAEALRQMPVLNSAGRAVAPPLAFLMNQARNTNTDALVADPQPNWIFGFLETEHQVTEARGGGKRSAVRRWLEPTARRAAVATFKKNPWMRPVEEMRWILRQENLQDREKRNFNAAVADWSRAAAQAAIDGTPPPPRPTKKEYFFTQPEINEQVAQRHEWWKTHPDYQTYKKVAEQIAGYDRLFVELDAATGRISKEQAQAMLREGYHYAPIYSTEFAELTPPLAVPEGDVEALHRGDPYPFLKQGLQAGHRLALPTVATLKKAESTMRRAHKQHNINQFRRLVERFPEYFAREGVFLDRKPKDAQMPQVYRFNKKAKFFQVDAYEDGTAKPIIMPQTWAAAFETLPENFQGFVLDQAGKVASMATALTRAGAIFNPRFAAMNLPRNEIEALWLGNREGAYRPFVDFFRGLTHFLGATETSDALKTIGVGGASVVSGDIHHAAVSLDDIALGIDATHADAMRQWAGRAIARFGKMWKSELAGTDIRHVSAAMVYPLAKLTEVTDTAGRFGSALRALEVGQDPQAAVEQSRRTHLDFGRTSQTGRKMNQLFPFWSARAVGLDMTWESVVRRGLPNMFMLISGALIVPELVHFLMRFDDEEYQAYPEWLKRKYYHVWKNADGTYVQWPRPLGILSQMFGYGIGETLRATYRKDPGVVGRVYAALSDEIPFVAETPIGIKEETGQVHPDFTRIAPEALLPLAELWANKKSFFDTEIVPAWMRHRPPEERAFRSTPQVYRAIARAAKPLEPLLGEVAPLQLEHIGRTVYGSTGSSLIKTAETGKRIARGEPVTWDEVPVLTAFIDRKRDAPSLVPVRQLFKLVNDEWKYKRAQKKGTRDRYEYDQLRKALNRVEKLIEARNNADQMLDFDTRNHLDREILRVSELALQQVGKRGEPGSGPLGDFWEKFK